MISGVRQEAEEPPDEKNMEFLNETNPFIKHVSEVLSYGKNFFSDGGRLFLRKFSEDMGLDVSKIEKNGEKGLSIICSEQYGNWISPSFYLRCRQVEKLIHHLDFLVNSASSGVYALGRDKVSIHGSKGEHFRRVIDQDTIGYFLASKSTKEGTLYDDLPSPYDTINLHIGKLKILKSFFLDEGSFFLGKESTRNFSEVLKAKCGSLLVNGAKVLPFVDNISVGKEFFIRMLGKLQNTTITQMLEKAHSILENEDLVSWSSYRKKINSFLLKTSIKDANVLRNDLIFLVKDPIKLAEWYVSRSTLYKGSSQEFYQFCSLVETKGGEKRVLQVVYKPLIRGVEGGKFYIERKEKNNKE